MNARVQEIIKKTDKDKLILIIHFFVMFIICLLHSFSAGHYVDFFPTNGTFQNFNPVRRLLNGQIPYRDFQDYLGLGHLYLGSIVTLAFGGTYHASLMAFSFLQFLSLAICSCVIGRAVFQKIDKAVMLTNIFLLCDIIQPLFFKNAIIGTDEIYSGVTTALVPGNSARFIRGLVLPLAVILMLIGYNIYKKYIDKICKNAKIQKIIPYFGMGIVAAFSFVWSNDYGISCWLCISILSFWISFSRTRSFINSIIMMLVEVFSSLIGIIVFVEIFTLGHLPQWISSTFGTGGYQSWYYNSPKKSFYIFDVDFSYIICIQAGLAIFYLFKIFMNKGSVVSLKRYGLLGFMNMTCFCAVNEYKIMSGGNAREVALSILYLTVFFELINHIENLFLKNHTKKLITVFSLIVCFSWIIATCKDEFVFHFLTEKEGVYVEELGGNLLERGDDLIKTDEFLSGEDVWSTYASAQELVADKYQPSGTDYIIHAMGDQQRINYLNRYKEGDFRYTSTIKDDFTGWECWIRQANWFFYRELYKNWHPVYSNSYELYWEKNESESENVVMDNIELSIEDIDDSTKKIIVKSDSEVNGFADVYIDYDIQKNNNRSAIFLINKMLRVENTGTVYAKGENNFGGEYYETNYLRDKSKEYIPIRMVNGYGEVTISSNPSRSTFLKVNECSCKEIFLVTSNYVSLESVSDDRYSINITASQNNIEAVKNIKEVCLQDNAYEVENVEINNESIKISLKNEVEYIEGGANQVQLIR